jgi:hypothetical protein
VRIGKLTYTALLAVLLGASGLYAQDDGLYSYALKMRLGLVGGDIQKTHYDNKLLGFGVQVKREMFGKGRALSAELSWEYVPGRHFDITDYAKHVGPNDFDKGILSLHPYFSFDDRKESGRGFSLLVAYHSKFPSFGGSLLNEIADGMEWFAGIRLDRYSVYSEYKWTLRDQTDPATGERRPVNPPPAAAPNYLPAIYEKGGNGTGHSEGASLTPGAFAGLSYRFNKDFRFELGTRYFGMKHWDVTPGAYFGEEEYRIKAGTTYGYTIEFALSCRI